MKNQYFGDRRDFFKYDLVLHLLEDMEALDQFTFLVMLTEPDGGGDGSLVSYDHPAQRQDLRDHLQRAVRFGERNVNAISPFFRGQGLACHVYDELFSHSRRLDYFRSVAPGHLQRAVVLLDPDNGFEVASTGRSNGDKYVRFAETQDLYERMSDECVLLVYQHIPRVQRETYFRNLSAQVAERVAPVGCVAVTDNQIAFIALTKTPERSLGLDTALSVYADRNHKHQVIWL